MTPESPKIVTGGGEAPAEPPLLGEIDALDEAEAEFAEGKTSRLEDVLHRRRPSKG